jgi:putative nucleotidyltransferase with HDIG domain
LTPARRAPVPVKRAALGDDNGNVSEPDPIFEFATRELDSLQTDRTEPTVLAWRSAQDWGDVRELVVRTDARVAELMLGLVRETAEARNDEARLLAVIGRFAFEAFPNATHHVLAAREHAEAPLHTIIARARAGDGTSVPLSRTIVERVLRDGHALLFMQGQDLGGQKESIVMSRLETAIVAPLAGVRGTFGVIQLDVRKPARGRFTKEDLDMLSVFASQVGLALEHLWLHQQQQRAFQSTIGALVHSLTLKDKEVAQHCERVRRVAMAIGERLGLSDTELEILSVAALLHDLGKQGVRDEVLTKPGRLTETEKQEMDQHATYTQSILDMIEYPPDLWDVPRIAAYHHEKIDGTGPFGVAGDNIPRAARIISVADVFDALVSARSYKPALPPEQALARLAAGKGRDWDVAAVEALHAVVGDLLTEVYRLEPGRTDGDDSIERAA